jgi:ATP-binding cassette subfamily B protein
MENGRIVQTGTHEELMRVPGPYLRVADLQLVDRRELLKFMELQGGTT